MLSTVIAGVRLENPTVLASGIMGTTASSLGFCARSGAGALTTKSISLKPRKGHKNPTVLRFENGIINAVGLTNRGAEDSLEEIRHAAEISGRPIIASIFGTNTADYGRTAKIISKAKPDMIEANISCPNVEEEMGKPFATDPKASARVTRNIKRNTKLPVFVKLSPNVPDISSIAKAVKRAGADGITAINTAGPGMVIDINTAQPILHNKAGGISGPAIRPIAVRCVYDIYRATKLPVIGTGGITKGNDAVEMIMAGASAVGIGSSVYYRGIDVFNKITEEIKDFMLENGYNSIEEMRGIAHE